MSSLTLTLFSEMTAHSPRLWRGSAAQRGSPHMGRQHLLVNGSSCSWLLTKPRTSDPEKGKTDRPENKVYRFVQMGMTLYRGCTSPFAFVSAGTHSRQADGADRRGVRDGRGDGRGLGQDELPLPDEAGGDEAVVLHTNIVGKAIETVVAFCLRQLCQLET